MAGGPWPGHGPPGRPPHLTTPGAGHRLPARQALFVLLYDGHTCLRGRADFGAAPSATFLLVDEAGHLTGPPAIWIVSQPLGNTLQGLGTAIRYHLHFSERAQEIAILMVAHHRDSPFERFAHQQAGLKKGLTQEDINAILAGRPPTLVSGEERAVYEATRRILDAGTLDAQEYEKYAAELSVAHLFELVALIGYYSMLATQLSVFDIQPPAPIPASQEGITK